MKEKEDKTKQQQHNTEKVEEKVKTSNANFVLVDGEEDGGDDDDCGRQARLHATTAKTNKDRQFCSLRSLQPQQQPIRLVDLLMPKLQQQQQPNYPMSPLTTMARAVD
ncbi:hypothetical protein TYRP_009761 [Tyrophagus putrescentiae]|nr:hypothetical protein TYRP_009761 [Tyrophagus putrescentiae]